VNALPTAVHCAELVEQETPLRLAKLPSGGGASGWVAQLTPFQTALVPSLVARHAVAVTQATP
jgi:hypothetical protein